MLAFESTGSGVPLLFLHAFPLNLRMWEANRPALSKNFRLITMDLPGFGNSPPLGDTSRMEDMARAVAETLDGLKIKDRIVAAGLSMGGYVLMSLVNLMPERFRALGFFATRTEPDAPEARLKRLQTIEKIQKEGLYDFSRKTAASLLGKTTQEKNPELVGFTQELIAQANPFGVCAALHGMAERPDTTSVLGKIEGPTLIMAGEEDGVIPCESMGKMASRIKNSRFELLPKAGHLLNMEQPEAFASVFMHFLKRSVL